MDDVRRLRQSLAPVEELARTQRWDAQRPWRVRTHVFWQGELPTLDGHDLSAKGMKRALAHLAEVAAELDTGAARIVTGAGRHTVGAGGVLGKVVQGSLGRRAAEAGWTLRSEGPASWVLLVDATRAPRSATGAWGPGTWLWFAFFGLAVAVTVLRLVGVLP